MLDNTDNEHHIDHAFAKASWNNMSTMLDQEMPVEAKESNKLVPFLSALLLLSFIAIGVLIHMNLNQPKFAEVTKEKVSIKNIYIPVDNNLQKQKPSAEVNINTNSSPTTGNNPISSIDYTGANSNSYTTINSASSTLGTIRQLSQTIHSPLNISDISSGISSDIISTDSQLATVENLYAMASIGNLDHSLDLKARELLGIGDVDFTYLKDAKERSKRKIKYRLSLITSVANNFDFTGYGFSLGLEIPLSKKLAFSLDLAHNELSRDFYVLPFFKKEQTPDILALVKPLTNNQVTERAFYAGLKNMKQILIPAKINYSITNFFAISTGANVRYTYNRIIDNPVNAFNNRAERYKKQEELEKRGNSRSYFVDSTIGLTAGVKLKATKNLSFALDTEWGIQSILDKEAFAYPRSKAYNLNLLSFSTNFSF